MDNDAADGEPCHVDLTHHFQPCAHYNRPHNDTQEPPKILNRQLWRLLPGKGNAFANALIPSTEILKIEMATLAVVSGENASTNPAESSSKYTFNVGTRKSKLALVQTDIVVRSLASMCPENTYAIKARDTAAGDIDKLTPFKDMPVKNLWTHELETLMVEGQLDFLVHSLKG
jgi:hypothetical protein